MVLLSSVIVKTHHGNRATKQHFFSGHIHIMQWRLPTLRFYYLAAFAQRLSAANTILLWLENTARCEDVILAINNVSLMGVFPAMQ